MTINEHFEIVISNLIDEFSFSSEISLKELKDPIDSVMINDNCIPILYLKNESAYFFDICNK